MWWLNAEHQSFCLIMADGEKPTVPLIKHYRALSSFFIALDGAANWLLEQNIQPDIVIGDMDSFDSKKWPHINRLYIAEQNTNDFEKALSYAKHQGFSHILTLGAFGQRIDHFLTNLYVMRKYARDLQLSLVDDQQCAFMCKKGAKVDIFGMNNRYLSLFPLSAVAGPLTTTGVEYPLNNERLYLKSRIGTLNRIIADYATISSEGGDTLVMLPGPTACRQGI